MKRALLPVLVALVFVPQSLAVSQTYPNSTQLGWAAIRVAGQSRPVMRIDLVQGAGERQLAQGLGHWEDTPLPGQSGTVAFSGHRTTIKRPLYDLDAWPLQRTYLRIYMRLPVRSAYCYRLVGRKIVPETDTSPAYKRQAHEVVQLWACHPKRQRSKRIIGYFRQIDCSEAN